MTEPAACPAYPYSLAFLAVSHMLVDAVCAMMIFSGLRVNLLSTGDFATIVIIYNTLAFAMQAPLGVILDRWQNPRLAIILSFLALAVSAAGLWYSPFAAIIIAGLANALFHLGGGTISFYYSPGKASMPGVFVAPGDIGLFAGTLLGKSGNISALAAIPVLILFAAVIFFIRLPKVDYSERTAAPHLDLERILLLVFVCIAVRSMIGTMAVFPWEKEPRLLLMLTAAIVIGKGIGGFLADRYGWIRVPIAGLLLSAPILAFGRGFPALAIAGMLLFQMTMPVTLTALYKILPGRPGFAFGLSALALMIGLMPGYLPIRAFLSCNVSLLVSIIISAAALFAGLKLLFRNAVSDVENAITTIQLKQEVH
jgi:MFS transporter, FSR family, fosmidomycin resistance protein